MRQGGRLDCSRKGFGPLATRVKSGGNERGEHEMRQEVVGSDGAGGVTWSNVADSEATARAHRQSSSYTGLSAPVGTAICNQCSYSFMTALSTTPIAFAALPQHPATWNRPLHSSGSLSTGSRLIASHPFSCFLLSFRS